MFLYNLMSFQNKIPEKIILLCVECCQTYLNPLLYIKYFKINLVIINYTNTINTIVF